MDDLPIRRADLVTQLGREDLDRLSVDELDERVAALEAEIVRTRAKRDASTSHRASADQLFKR